MLFTKKKKPMRIIIVLCSFCVLLAAAIDNGPTYGMDYAGLHYNVTGWNSSTTNQPDNWKASASTGTTVGGSSGTARCRVIGPRHETISKSHTQSMRKSVA